MRITDKDVLFVQDVAEIMSISDSTAYRIFKSKGFPMFHIGRKLAVQSARLQDWMAEQEEK